MAYTPVELRHVRVPRAFFGYRRGAIQELLTELADSFETVWRERHELADHVEALEGEVASLREREHALTQTLVAAEQAASAVREHAKHEADLILSEAHAEARSIMRDAHGERERLLVDARRIETMLRGALDLVGDALPEPEQPASVDEDTQEPQLLKVSGADWAQ